MVARRRVLLGLSAALCAPSLPPALAAPATIRGVLHAWAPRAKVPHAVVAVAWAGTVQWAEGRGRYRPDTPVLLASLSKAVTGAAILALVGDGRISPDDTLGTLLAATFRRVGRPKDEGWLGVTVGDLARHTSGLPGNRPHDPVGPSVLAPLHGRAGAGIDDALRLALDAPAGPPGGFAYSNLGYLLLGHVVEASMGRPYADHVQDRILRPLGVLDARIDPAWAVAGPFGGWMLSARDYLRFLHVFDPKAGVIAPSALALADAEPRYGYGRFREPARGGWGHTGSWGPRTAMGQRGDAAWFLGFAADAVPAKERDALRADLIGRMWDLV